MPRRISWLSDNLRHTLALCTLALGLGAAPISAQEEGPQPTLEDLIPDSAVDNPDEWAQQGTDPVASDLSEEEPDPDTPITDLSEITVPWPTDITIEPFEPLTPEADIEFVQLDEDRPQITFEDAETVDLGNNLILGFPQTEPPFAERGDFVERFEALSTVENLDNADATVAQLAARAQQDEELLNNLLRVYGYYDGQVIRSIGTIEAGQDTATETPTVRFDIIPGERYTYAAIDLGNLRGAPDYTQLRAAFGIQPGDYLQSDKIVEEQYDLDYALGEAGYPFATIDEPQLLIDHAVKQGDLTLAVEPSGKYVFGNVVSSDPSFLSGKHLSKIARFEPGDIYQRSLSMDLRRAITATGLVSSVEI